MSHWICRVGADKKRAGGHLHTQFTHVETPDSTPPADYEIEAGPSDTAEGAWAMWHLKQGTLKQ